MGLCSSICEFDGTMCDQQKMPPLRWHFCLVEAAGIEPASVSGPPLVLHAYLVVNLTISNPTSKDADSDPSGVFNGFTLGELHRELA